MRTLKLLAAGDVDLGDGDGGQSVLDEEQVVFDDRVADLDAAVIFDGKGGIGSDGVAVGSNLLVESVGLASIQATNDLRLLGRNPLGNDGAFGVDNLNRSALELLASDDGL